MALVKSKQKKRQQQTYVFDMLRKDKKLKLFLAVSVIPSVALSIYLRIIPTVRVFIMSFYNQTAIAKSDPTWAGLENYAYLFKDEYFKLALRNTLLLMVFATFGIMFFGLLMAIIITQGNLKEKKIYRVVMFLPSIISISIVGILWSFI